MNKKVLFACASSLFLVACGSSDDDDNSSSNEGNPMTVATDGVYEGIAPWARNGNAQTPDAITMTFEGNEVTVRRGSLTGTAQFSGDSYSVTERASECGWIYTGTVSGGETQGTIGVASCPVMVTGTYSATRQ